MRAIGHRGLRRPPPLHRSSIRPPSLSREAGELSITWEVKNRFRLFRNEKDFERQAAAHQGSVLAAERRLAEETQGEGWAKDVVDSLCVDVTGKLLESCSRDGERELYLSPRNHRIGVAGGRTAASQRHLRLVLP